MSTFALKSKVKRDYIKLKEDKIMKNVKFIAGALCAALMVSSCNMNKTAAGALIGTGAGAAGGTGLGAAIGALVNGVPGVEATVGVPVLELMACATMSASARVAKRKTLRAIRRRGITPEGGVLCV